MAEVTLLQDERRSNLHTQPELRTASEKGTMIISEADVLANPILALGEKQTKERYGNYKI